MGFLLMAGEKPELTGLLTIPAGYRIMAAAVVGHPDIRPDGPPQRNPPRIDWFV
jgi:hypothetical protein